MKIKIVCNGPTHADEPQNLKEEGLWVDLATVLRDLSAPGCVYMLTPVCTSECDEKYLNVVRVD